MRPLAAGEKEQLHEGEDPEDDRDQPLAGERVAFEGLATVDAEKHDHEQEQNDDRARVHDDLHRGQELRVLLDEEHRDAEKRHHEHERRMDGVARQDDPERPDDADDRRDRERDGVGDRGGGEDVGHVPCTLPPKRREILSLSTVRMEMLPVAASSRRPLWPPSGVRTP